MSDKKIQEPSKCVEELRNWLNQQPHLSKDIDDHLLLRFVHSCYYNVDKAKTSLETFCNIRSEHPELFSDRDPLSPEMQATMNIFNIGHSKAGNKQIWIWQLNDETLQTFDFLLHIKLSVLFLDACLLHIKDIADVDIVIYDGKDVSFKFITKFSLSIARIVLRYQQDAIPMRLKQLHFVNASSIVYRLYGLIKPFLYKEVAEMFYFHPPNSQSLFNYVDRDSVPSDFGGNQPPMTEFNKQAVDIIMNRRKELLRDDLWKTIPVEKKSKEPSNNGVMSFFRKLTFN